MITVNEIHNELEAFESEAGSLHHENYPLYRDFYRGGDLPLNYIRRNPRESRKHWTNRG